MITIHRQTVSSVDFLESTPPSVNGVLTACAGQQISLTCSHNTSVGVRGVTVWTASLPINCTSLVSHYFIPAATPCGPFIFEEITPVVGKPFPPLLHSTAVATAAVSMTNSTIECRGGTVINFVSICNVSLCIVGES